MPEDASLYAYAAMKVALSLIGTSLTAPVQLLTENVVSGISPSLLFPAASVSVE